VSLAWISIAALVLAVALSCTTTVNVGILSLSLALLVGVYLGGMTADAVLAGFPTSLLVTLIGVTLLFSIAECNGTLARLTARAVRLCRGHRGVLPIMFFIIGFLISTIGAGATPASALLAPPAMAVAATAGIPPLLMAIMAGNGALAGTLSPFAPTGIVAHGVMRRIGLGGVEWETYAYNALAHTIVGFGGFLLLGGWRLFIRSSSHSGFGPPVPTSGADPDVEEEPTHAIEVPIGQTVQTAAVSDGPTSTALAPLETRHWLTTTAIVLLVACVAGFGMNVGMVALVVSTMLILLRTVDEQKAIQRMPWGVILMVTGVTVLVAMLEKTKGLELFTAGIAGVATPATIAPIVSFGTGVVSVYSSTSGVVLPAFLPMVPSLAARLGGLHPLPIAWSMTGGASLVDLSSLSTVGALFIAGAAPGSDARRLFNSLLIWGLSMSIVGAVLCWLLFGFQE
jgi:di/tricarboxylate transporter